VRFSAGGVAVVDLFGCEINTICRVCLIADFANWSVGLLKAKEAADANQTGQNRFASQEQYTPVYDRNLSELRSLGSEVVTHVTEFYTYRKTMMDSFRRMAAESTDRDGREQATIQMIYMQFLMYESGRLAIEDLIDFEPNKIRGVISVLCSELVGSASGSYSLWSRPNRPPHDYCFSRCGGRDLNPRPSGYDLTFSPGKLILCPEIRHLQSPLKSE
jgi:hypothetical protein